MLLGSRHVFLMALGGADFGSVRTKPKSLGGN
jgi:hypothetical protein